MHYLVTGSSGFIGAHFVEAALEEGSTVIALIRKTSDLKRLQFSHSKLIFIETDFRNVEKAFEKIKNFPLEISLHFAWEGVQRNLRDHPLQKSNILLLDFFLRLSKKLKVKRFIGLGSQAEYGIKNKKIKENDELQPITFYGKEKVKACFFSKKFCFQNQMEFVWLRLFSSYGPKDSPSYLIPYVIQSFLKDQTPSLTDGLQKWDYLFIKDVAKKILSVCRSHQIGIFNLASGKAIQIKQIVETIYDLIKPKTDLIFGKAERKEALSHLEADVELFNTTFGACVETDLTKGLNLTIESLTQF